MRERGERHALGQLRVLLGDERGAALLGVILHRSPLRLAFLRAAVHLRADHELLRDLGGLEKPRVKVRADEHGVGLVLGVVALPREVRVRA